MALTGTEPPDDAFAESICEATSMVTPEMTIDGALVASAPKLTERASG